MQKILTGIGSEFCIKKVCLIGSTLREAVRTWHSKTMAASLTLINDGMSVIMSAMV